MEVFGVVAIILICIVAYVTVSPRLLESDVQSLFWGRMLSTTFPIWLTAFGVLFTVVLFGISAKGVNAK